VVLVLLLVVAAMAAAGHTTVHLLAAATQAVGPHTVMVLGVRQARLLLLLLVGS
jgi:hypothetical protein